MRGAPILVLVALLAGSLPVCANGGRTAEGEGRPLGEPADAGKSASTHEEVTDSMRLTSDAFEDGGTIPRRHTCDDEDVSPALEWEGVPEGSVSFALLVHDPDAPRGDWVHWVIYDIPGHFGGLPEDVGPAPRLEDLGEAAQGENDFGRIGWGGPCPPPGKPHRYVLTLTALDVRLGLEPGASREEVEEAARDHVLATARLTGRYGR
ncbi:MAG TPA: YbhB/YbcL family Raf kinase inhibitor-like protein [Gemmatimonadota bacterium]|nr:YbhB/YbcL family Raf kinase inhibitor-like protein [Gemmatimonadota bacterium]